eukprot:Gb_23263 [translate_table: standard]
MALNAVKNARIIRGAFKWPKQITPEHVLDMIKAERDVRKALGIFNSATGEYPNGFKHNQATFGLMIARLACAGQFVAAESLLQRMNHEKCQCTEEIFVTLSRAYGRAHKPLEALRTFHKMKDFQCKPTQKSYITIFAVLVQENLLKMAHKFYAYMNKVGIEPHVSTFNILIKALCKGPHTLDGAFKVFRKMPQKGCIPDSFTYSTLIDGLCKHGRLSDAKEIMEEMQMKGCAPNVVTYSTMIHGFCISSQLDDAMKLLDEMAAKKISPNVVTYSTLMHGLCKVGRSLEAMNLLDKMVRTRQYPNMITYTSLINGLCKEGKINAAMEILDQMKLKGWTPDAALYNMLVTTFCNGNKLQEAANLLDEMILSGVTPNAVTGHIHQNMHCVVIQGFCKAGKLDLAFQIYLSMLTRRFCPNLDTFNLLVDGFCKKGDVYKAARIVTEMMTNGCVPDNSTWTTIVRGFWNRRKPTNEFHSSSGHTNVLQFETTTKCQHRLPQILDVKGFVLPISKIFFLDQRRGCGIGMVWRKVGMGIACNIAVKCFDRGTLPVKATWSRIVISLEKGPMSMKQQEKRYRKRPSSSSGHTNVLQFETTTKCQHRLPQILDLKGFVLPISKMFFLDQRRGCGIGMVWRKVGMGIACNIAVKCFDRGTLPVKATWSRIVISLEKGPMSMKQQEKRYRKT